ncbi:MAG: flavodoxin family protein [Desulfobacteraceae bacterium]
MIKMKVLGIYGSPRKGGNSDHLLDKALEGARSAGGEINTVYARLLKMSGCLECGGCDQTGECVVQDDMQSVYPLLDESEVIFLASPIFFYGLTSQVKAIVDRSQAMWSRRMLRKSHDQLKTYDSGRGYLIAVGATRGPNLFEAVKLEARYFFDALDMSFEGGVYFRRMEKKDAVQNNPEALQEAFNLGLSAVRGKQ